MGCACCHRQAPPLTPHRERHPRPRAPSRPAQASAQEGRGRTVSARSTATQGGWIGFFNERTCRKRSAHSSSNLARVTSSERSRPGISPSISTRTSTWVERARLARSASRRSFCMPAGFFEGSLPGCFFLTSESRCSINRLSKSSPAVRASYGQLSAAQPR